MMRGQQHDIAPLPLGRGLAPLGEPPEPFQIVRPDHLARCLAAEPAVQPGGDGRAVLCPAIAAIHAGNVVV